VTNEIAISIVTAEGLYACSISIIFSDYKLLEAEIAVVEIYGIPSIKIDGKYF